MPYHRKHHKSLEKEIKEVVEKELRKDIALKRFNEWDVISAVVNTGTSTCTDLSEIPMESLLIVPDIDNRSAAVIQAKTLRIRLQLQAQAPSGADSTWRDGASLIRYIIFSWAPYDAATNVLANSPEAIVDLYESPPVGLEILAPWVGQGLKGQFKVHVDETVKLEAVAGSHAIPDPSVPSVITYQVCRTVYYQFHGPAH